MIGVDLTEQPTVVIVVTFVAAGLAIWLAGARLAFSADRIAEITGLGQAFVGLVLLAGATELPELVTSLGAIAIGDAPLAVNNLFGGIVMQTAILAVADARIGGGPLSWFTPRPVVVLQGVLLIVLLAAVLAFVVIGDSAPFGGPGLATTAICASYVGALFIVRRFEAGEAWRPVDIPDPPELASQARTAGGKARNPIPTFVLASVVVLAAGSLLVNAAEALIARTTLGSSFVGAALLASTTSLPELSTTLAAVRIGSYGLAFANIFGSNAIMIALLFLCDAGYPGPILNTVGPSGTLAAVSGIAVTGIYLVGLLLRRNRAVLRMGIDSWIVLAAYLATLVALYRLRGT